MIHERMVKIASIQEELTWFYENHDDPSMNEFVKIYADAIINYVDMHDIKTKPAWKLIKSFWMYPHDCHSSVVKLFNIMHDYMYNEDDYLDYLCLVLEYKERHNVEVLYDKKYISENIIEVSNKIQNVSIIIKLLRLCDCKSNSVIEMLDSSSIVIAMVYLNFFDNYEIYFMSDTGKKNFSK